MYQPRKILKGQIYYLNKAGGSFVGSEQAAGRPAIADMPTHIPISSARKPSLALCEEIVSVDKQRLEKYIGTITSEEMQQVNQAMMISLGILPESLTHMISKMMMVYVKDREHKIETEVDRESYIRTQAERDVYKKLYGDLLYTHLGR